jgi:hypothetical protein
VADAGEGEEVIWSGSEHHYREKDFRIRDCLFVLTEKERLWRLIEEEGKQSDFNDPA